MQIFVGRLIGSLLILVCAGCALQRQPVLAYLVEAFPIQNEGNAEFYKDPVDSTFVWSEDGLQLKVRFLNDLMLDERFDPAVSPYTLTGWVDPNLGYTPPPVDDI